VHARPLLLRRDLAEELAQRRQQRLLVAAGLARGGGGGGCEVLAKRLEKVEGLQDGVAVARVAKLRRGGDCQGLRCTVPLAYVLEAVVALSVVRDVGQALGRAHSLLWAF